METVKNIVKEHWGVICVLLMLFWAIQPLLRPGFFPMHDDEQVGRLYELHQDILAGHLPPRLAQDLGFGYDYPLFNFYPPFVYYIAEIFVLLGFGYITSIKLMIALGFTLAALFMYVFSKKYVGVVGAVVAAVAYTYAPYHSVDVYVRGALPEFWSFVFIPAIFWSLAKLEENNKTRYVLVTSLLIAGFILTHNLIAFMSAPFIGLFGLYLLWRTKSKKIFLFQSITSMALGLGISAYFWLPSYVERDATMIALLTKELADYTQHFVYIRQLWDSPWGYGGSLLGLNDGLSFQIGKLHSIAVVVGLGFSISLFQKKRKEVRLLLLFILLFLLATFMNTFYSKFIWDAIPQLAYVQFPWRFLVFTAFTSSFVLGFLFQIPFLKSVKVYVAILLIFITILLYKDYFQPAKYLPSAVDTDYTSMDALRWHTSSMSFEYVPNGIATKKSSVGNTIVDITKSEIAKASYTIVKGDAVVSVVKDVPQEKILRVRTIDDTMLRLTTYSFPGWNIFLNGRQIRYNDDNKLKLITVVVPKGTSEIVARFTDTLPRRIGNTLSLMSLGGGVLIWFYFIYRKRKKV